MDVEMSSKHICTLHFKQSNFQRKLGELCLLPGTFPLSQILFCGGGGHSTYFSHLSRVPFLYWSPVYSPPQPHPPGSDPGVEQGIARVIGCRGHRMKGQTGTTHLLLCARHWQPLPVSTLQETCDQQSDLRQNQPHTRRGSRDTKYLPPASLSTSTSPGTLRPSVFYLGT